MSESWRKKKEGEEDEYTLLYREGGTKARGKRLDKGKKEGAVASSAGEKKGRNAPHLCHQHKKNNHKGRFVRGERKNPYPGEKEKGSHSALQQEWRWEKYILKKERGGETTCLPKELEQLG